MSPDPRVLVGTPDGTPADVPDVPVSSFAPAQGPVRMGWHETLGLRVESRTDDPATTDPGCLWYRVDLEELRMSTATGTVAFRGKVVG